MGLGVAWKHQGTSSAPTSVAILLPRASEQLSTACRLPSHILLPSSFRFFILSPLAPKLEVTNGNGGGEMKVSSVWTGLEAGRIR